MIKGSILVMLPRGKGESNNITFNVILKATINFDQQNIIGFTTRTMPTHFLIGQQGSRLHKEHVGAFLISTTPATLTLFIVTSNPATSYLTENSMLMLLILAWQD